VLGADRAGFGIGAQFGASTSATTSGVIRLPRHGASLPVGVAVSCSADRQAKAKITADGVFPGAAGARPGPVPARRDHEHLDDAGESVRIDLNRPMAEIRGQLSALPVRPECR
jgi:fumarate hydratase class I